ncbi:hypothetical protein J7T55_005191 [Diaporthe amygdali]|uniref:uncharacterized protein n=1 Tax=Phomopsis amygdali TaxID=1214568 RepID=UPI0022FE11ED|nr:uncharacterized protein J7T55_005191 [Diaporthe amygdali]KAJ0116245.1 hypothetical protein J7T55_005191 [Diaporthe amygdali]
MASIAIPFSSQYSNYNRFADDTLELIPLGAISAVRYTGSDTMHILHTRLSYRSWSQERGHPYLDPYFEQHYHPPCEGFCCFLNGSDGRYYGAQIILALPAHGRLPLLPFVSILDLRIYGFLCRLRSHRPQLSHSDVEAEPSVVVVEETDEETSDEQGGAEMPYEGDQMPYEGDGWTMVMNTMMLNIFRGSRGA